MNPLLPFRAPAFAVDSSFKIQKLERAGGARSEALARCIAVFIRAIVDD